MSNRSSIRPRWRPRGLVARTVPVAVILAAIVALVVVALGEISGTTRSARTEREVVTAADGVVQKTATGTGNVEPVTAEDVDFQTSGTLKHVYVKEGEYVRKGQLLATLDGESATLTLREARATLTQARATLSSDRTKLAKQDESSSDDTSDDVTDAVDQTVTSTQTTTTTTGPTKATTTPTTATTTTTTPETATSGTTTSPTATNATTTSSDTVTAATIDSDRLTVLSDAAAVAQDADDVAETRLTAPASGTITSLESIEPGDSVSSGTSASASSSDSTSSTGSSSSSSTGAGGSSGATSSSGSTGSSGSTSSSSSSTFAEIDSLHHLSMTVTFTESDISELKVGEPAVVTMDALSGVQLAGTVTAVSSLGTTDDDVVSYEATITLSQHDSRVKPGMSASAEVIIRQGHGVTVPSSAVTGTGTLATVEAEVDGRETTRKVIVGLRGSSEDLIVSGLTAGERLVETETLPSTGSSAGTSTTSGSSRGSGTLGGSGRGGSGGFGGFGGGGGTSGGGGPSSGGGPP